MVLPLTPQSKPFDQFFVAVFIFIVQIVQEPAALTNHHQQTPTRVKILFMNF